MEYLYRHNTLTKEVLQKLAEDTALADSCLSQCK